MSFMTSSSAPTRRIGVRRIPAVVYRAVIDASPCDKTKDDGKGYRVGAEAARPMLPFQAWNRRPLASYDLRAKSPDESVIFS
jgi:hypothetical protein